MKYKEMHSAIVILAASTTCVEDFVYPKSSHGNADYPDLNNSVFFCATDSSHARRRKAVEYCKVRYPNWEIEGKELLHKTGGVGQFIADYHASRLSWQPRSILDEVLASPPLFVMCIAILSKFNHNVHSGPWPTFGISFLEARNVLMESC